MNILVTGATGFVGINLVKELKKRYNIFFLVRPTTKYEKKASSDHFVFDDNIDDLCCFLNENKISGIVHLASLYISQHESSQIKDLILSNLYLGTALLEASVKADLKWFLNTGTIWQNYISDSVDYCPVNLYAATKQAFIDIAQYYAEISDLKFCTLKLCDTYGPNDSRKKILALFKQISETGETLNMSPGNQKLDLLHINDVVAGFVVLINKLISNASLESEYVLSSGHPIRLTDLAKLYEDITNRKLYINWGAREYRNREVMDPWRKGSVLVDWKPIITLEEGIVV